MGGKHPEEVSFPVVGYHFEDDKYELDNLFGTSVYLNNNVFITAGHSILNAQQSEYAGIAFRDDLTRPSNYNYHPFVEVEVFNDIDIGIVRLGKGYDKAVAPIWSLERPMMLEDVYTIGYPFGFNISEQEIVPRGYKGQIITQRKFHEFPKKPIVFELTFHCPRGISGASLNSYNNQGVKGFIIGNSSTEILVFEEKEYNEDTGEKRIFEKYETTKYGIAITVENILDIESKILGGSFRSYLLQEKLLV